MRTLRHALLAFALVTRTAHADPPAPAPSPADIALAAEADAAAAAGQRGRAAEIRRTLLTRLRHGTSPLALATLRALAEDHDRLHEPARALAYYVDYLGQLHHAHTESALDPIDPAPVAEALARTLVLARVVDDPVATRRAFDSLQELARDFPALREGAAEQVLAFLAPPGPTVPSDALVGPLHTAQDARAVLTLLDAHASLFGPRTRLDLRLRASVLRGRALRALGDGAGAWQAYCATVQAWRAARLDEPTQEPWLEGRDPEAGLLRVREAERRAARRARRFGGMIETVDDDRTVRRLDETPTARAAREAVAEARFALALAMVQRAWPATPAYDGPPTGRAFDLWCQRVLVPFFMEHERFVQERVVRQFQGVIDTSAPAWEAAAVAQLGRLFLDLAEMYRTVPRAPDVSRVSEEEAYRRWRESEPVRQNIQHAEYLLQHCVDIARSHPEAAPVAAECASTLHALDWRRFPAEELRPALRLADAGWR
jgi:hypothetical protein